MNFAHNKIMEESNLGLKICNQSVDHLRHNLNPLPLYRGNTVHRSSGVVGAI